MPALPTKRPPPSSSSSTARASTNLFPTSFRVATSSTPRDPLVDDSDFATLQASTASRALALSSTASITLKLEVVESLCEPSCSLEQMKTAAPILDQGTWDDLLQERHMLGLCPYATCGKAAAKEYKPEASGSSPLRVKLKSDGGLYNATGEGDGAFCSKECAARSAWYKGRCVGRHNPEMLEVVEVRRRQVARSAREVAAASKETTTTTLPQPPLPEPALSTASDLLATLAIHERPTPASPPTAPSLSTSLVDFERPSSTTSNPTLSRTRTPLAPMPASSSLLPFNTRPLTSSLLAASSTLSRTSRAPAGIRQPTRGLDGLPPPLFLTGPVMLDEGGREVEWAAEVDEEGESDEIRRMMEEAMEVRRRVRDGEI